MRLKGLILFAVVIAAVYGAYVRTHNHSQNAAKNSGAASSSSASSASSKGFDKHKYSINDSASLWVVVNKARVLPSNYAPADLVVPNVPLRDAPGSEEMHLRAEAGTALENLVSEATKSGIKLRLSSGYRSYANQQSLYAGYVAQSGREAADASSARPGHSEHQTGLAADLSPTNRVCDMQQCFAATPEGKWLAANAYKSGFIIRYRQGTQSVVGYQYEPWHVRFLGTDLAARIQQSGKTVEEFFGLPPAPVYPVSSYELKLGR